MTNKRIFSSRAALVTALLAWGATALPGISNAANPPSDAPAAVSDTVRQHLIAEERASWDLAIKRNAAAYTALHAPDFFTVTGTGVVDKAHSEVSALDPSARFDRCELSGFDVRLVAQNAALVTYHVEAAGLEHGNAFRLDGYASSLWMRRDGTWTNVFYQATPAAKQ